MNDAYNRIVVSPFGVKLYLGDGITGELVPLTYGNLPSFSVRPRVSTSFMNVYTHFKWQERLRHRPIDVFFE